MKRIIAIKDWIVKQLLSKPILFVISLIGTVAIIISEYDPVTLMFIFCIFCTMWGLLLFISRRVAFSLLMTWVIIGFITVVSFMKFRFLRVSFSAFDLIYYLRNAGVVNFLSNYFVLSTIIATVGAILGLIVAVFVFKKEKRTTLQSWQIFMMLIFSTVSVYLTYPSAASGGGFNYCLAGHRSSCFFASLGNLPYLFGKNPLQRTLDTIHTDEKYPPQKVMVSQSKPDIIIVLMESAVQPELYSAIKAPKSLSENFKAADGKIHTLQTETFGGGTWITMTGLMASIPAVEFDWMRPYISLILEGGIHHSLPQYLKDQGYATVAISPGNSTFMDEDAFLRSLGFEKYFDFRAIGAPTVHERDQFYFDYALNYIKQHHQKDQRPLLLFFMTMGTHWPFDFRIDPDRKVSGEPFGNDEETDEYLRRLTMLQQELQQFKKQLKTNTTKEGALVIDFGDHQPLVTRNFAEAIDGDMALGKFDSVAFKTYYNITPINRQLATPLPEFNALHIMYLAPTILASAGFPLDDIFKDLIKIRDECANTACSERDLRLHYLKKLVNSDLLEFNH